MNKDRLDLVEQAVSENKSGNRKCVDHQLKGYYDVDDFDD